VNHFSARKSPKDIRFAADRMLGRLARLLRLLGYDTLYSPAVTAAELLEQAVRDGRVVLSRGNVARRFGASHFIFSVANEHPEEQLREVVEHFRLETRSGLWTRCTLCNSLIEPVEKAVVADRIPPRAFEAYADFYRCSSCGHLYWQGTHVERMLKKLATLLPE
jgi:hypothetical protein